MKKKFYIAPELKEKKIQVWSGICSPIDLSNLGSEGISDSGESIEWE